MSYKKRSIVAGKVIETTVYHCPHHESPKRNRKERSNPTPEKKAKNNERIAEEKLRVLLYENFNEGDWYITLTYEGDEPNTDDAKKILKNFLDRLRYLYKKHGLTLKYIGVTEYQKKRLHHHIIINHTDKFSKGAIKKAWGYGFVKVELFGGEPDDCERLASYMIKETSKTFRTAGRVHGKRWIESTNLVHPKPKFEIAHSGTWRQDPKPKKGYYISFVDRGYNQCDYPYMFYRMIRLDEGRERQNE